MLNDIPKGSKISLTINGQIRNSRSKSLLGIIAYFINAKWNLRLIYINLKNISLDSSRLT